MSERPSKVEKQTEPATNDSTIIATSAKATAAAPKKITTPQTPLIRGAKKVETPTEEKIKVAMIINGVKYDAAVKPDSSVYDLMNSLKQEGKISFSRKNYSGLGFFVEEINGVKNNPAGENWLYYVNGQPAPVGISNYKLKIDDTIEWQYEKKSFSFICHCEERI